jgi:hypothetical protein
MSQSLDGVPIKIQGVQVFPQDDGALLLLHPVTAQLSVTNECGWHIWGLVDGVRSVGGIAAEIRRVFDDVPSSEASEVESFIMELLKRGFVEMKGASR